MGGRIRVRVSARVAVGVVVRARIGVGAMAAVGVGKSILGAIWLGSWLGVGVGLGLGLEPAQLLESEQHAFHSTSSTQ